MAPLPKSAAGELSPSGYEESCQSAPQIRGGLAGRCRDSPPDGVTTSRPGTDLAGGSQAPLLQLFDATPSAGDTAKPILKRRYRQDDGLAVGLSHDPISRQIHAAGRR
jgi:hypothetical protein